MSFALSVVLLAVGALSVVAALRVTDGPTAEQVRGFCVVGAFGSFVVALAVLGVGLLWDGRIADAVAIIALFALVVYYLAALAIGYWPRRQHAKRPLVPDELDLPAP